MVTVVSSALIFGGAVVAALGMAVAPLRGSLALVAAICLAGAFLLRGVPMTTDIRERAERLLDALGAFQTATREHKIGALSQALLEAHNAGRAEALAEAYAEREVSPVEAAELREIVSNTLATDGVQEAVREGNALLGKLSKAKSE